jgi:PKD repeat protein
MADSNRNLRLVDDDRTDARAVSITVNHVLAMGITSILMVGLFASTGTFVANQVDSAGQYELEVIGNRLAAEIQVADRMAARGGQAELRVVQPSSVASGSYSVSLLTGSECDTPTFTSHACLLLESGQRGASAKVPIANTSNVRIRQANAGEFVITAEVTGSGAVDPRGGAGDGVDIDIGVGRNVSAPISEGENVTIDEHPPVAKFWFDPGSPSTDSVVHFDAGGSSDPDGEVVSYEWDVDGDGVTDATGETLDYSYANPGTYDVTVTVSDGTHTANRTKTIVVSGLTYERDAVAVDFGDSIAVPGGVNFSMKNGHNESVTIAEIYVDPRHNYVDWLEAHDTGPSTDAPEIVVSPESNPGTYANTSDGFLLGPGGQILELDDSSHSYDVNGSVRVDAGNTTNVTLAEFYAGGGSTDVDVSTRPIRFAVRYEVDGRTLVSKFTLFGGANEAPTPEFDAPCTGRDCELNASDSQDPDGTIVSYDWYVEGATPTGEAVNWTFASNGSFPVTLAVTDAVIPSSSVTASVTG